MQLTISAQKDNDEAFIALQEWARKNNVSLQDILNVLVVRAYFCLQTFTQPTSDGLTLELNLGQYHVRYKPNKRNAGDGA